MAEKMTWSDDDLTDGRRRSGVGGDRGGGGTRPRLPVVAVLVGGIVAAALVGSGVTWFLVHGSNPATQSAAPPLIKADEKPIKVYPESPGGMTEENSDKLVYSRLRGERQKGEVERILPEPEQPQKPQPADLAPASPPPSQVPSQASGPAPHAGTPAGDPHAATKQVPSMPIPLGTGPADAEDEPVAPPAPTAPAAKPSPKAAESKPVRVAAAKPLPAQPASKPAAKAGTADKPVAAPATGSFQVQILAARSSEDATAAWKKIQAKNGDVLGGLSSSVARADLGEKGVFYRLRVGPITSAAKAQSLCSTLASRNVSCMIIRSGR